MTTARPEILEQAATLADLTRSRILRLLEGRELIVAELCAVLQLPQSTVSRHLKVLAEGGWLQARRDGTSHFYQLATAQLPAAVGRLWALVREETAELSISRQDRERLAEVLAQRRSRSQDFFSTTAGRWDRLRDELFGNRFDLLALAALLERGWTVGDLACGTGSLAAALAPFVHRVVAVDGSPAMLSAARARLEAHANVEVREGELEALPIADARLDAAALVLALHHVQEPRRVLAEAQRVVKPGGRLLLVDMMPHDREAYRQEMGHVWLGFAAERIAEDLTRAGFSGVRYQALPAAPKAKGPTLFAATASRAVIASAVMTSNRNARATQPMFVGEGETS